MLSAWYFDSRACLVGNKISITLHNTFEGWPEVIKKEKFPRKISPCDHIQNIRKKTKEYM